MARTPITKTLATGSYPTDGLALTLEAADTTDQNDFLMTGEELLIAYNSGGSAYTVTITSVANAKGRTGTITADSIAAAASHIYGPFKKMPGWAQTGNKLHFEANNVAVKFAVIKLA